MTETDYTAAGYTTTVSKDSAKPVTTRTLKDEIGTGESTAAFTNTRNAGDLKVAKELSGNATDTNKAFDFTVTLRRTDAIPVKGNFEVPTGAEVTYSEDEKTATLTFTLKGKDGANSIVIGDVLSGTKYTIHEGDNRADGYILQSDVTDKTMGTEAVTETITNSRNTGDLIISKTVIGEQSSLEGDSFVFTVQLKAPKDYEKAVYDKTYTVDYNGDTEDGTIKIDSDGKGTLTLKDGQTAEIKEEYRGSQNASAISDEELVELAWKLHDTTPLDVQTFEENWIAFQTRYNEILPSLPIYSNVYFDFYSNWLHDYNISSEADWPRAILNAGWSEPVVETVPEETEEPEFEDDDEEDDEDSEEIVIDDM